MCHFDFKLKFKLENDIRFLVKKCCSLYVCRVMLGHPFGPKREKRATKKIKKIKKEKNLEREEPREKPRGGDYLPDSQIVIIELA